MQGKGKPIRLSGHAGQQLRFRGATEQQVIEAIQTETWEPAERGGTVLYENYTYDREVDALYIRFKETTITTKHLAERIAADYDADGRLA